MRVALVHHWLVTRRGGERCLESLARQVPGADLFTLVHDPVACPAPAGVARVFTSAAQHWPAASRHFRALLPLFPRLYASLDLSRYDLVLTSDAAVAKCVRPRKGALHLCYCYSPPRWAWDLAESYLEHSVAPFARPLVRPLLWALRRADRAAAQRVDRFFAVSQHVAARIARCYGRDSAVLPPPADTTFFRPAEPGAAAPTDGVPPPDGDGQRPYLVLGEAVPYKRFDVALDACRRLDRPLVVAGNGARLARLAAAAGARTTFVADPDDETVRALYRGCRALLFPGEEDFGLVPVEAMACGRAVIALGRGGATETVLDGTTGVLYAPDEGDPVGALVAAIRRFEAWEFSFSPSKAVQRAGIFSTEAHERALRGHLADAWRTRASPVAVRHA